MNIIRHHISTGNLVERRNSQIHLNRCGADSRSTHADSSIGGHEHDLCPFIDSCRNRRLKLGRGIAVWDLPWNSSLSPVTCSTAISGKWTGQRIDIYFFHGIVKKAQGRAHMEGQSRLQSQSPREAGAVVVVKS